MLKEANRLAAEGAHPRSIWNRTGWYKGAEGKWRNLIPDEEARLIGEPTFGNETHFVRPAPGPVRESMRSGMLPDVLHHPQLYKAYPELRRIEVQEAIIDPLARGRSGGFNPGAGFYGGSGGTPSITAIAPNEANLINTLLHEAQHGVQTVERFSPG